MSKIQQHLQQFNNWDIDLCQACNNLSRNRTALTLFRWISRLGNGVFWYTLMIILLLRYQAEALPAVIHMSVVGLLCTVLYKLIKHKTLRPRPFNVHPSIICNGQTLDQFSFPSGHTLHAVAFSIIVLAYFPALFWLVVPFAILVGISRPILGLHYPSDVLAGAGIGTLLATTSLYL
jgi:undecaprenyl-diphosphatase